MTKQTDYEDRQKAKKLVKVKVWVPEDKRQIVIVHAKKLRDEENKYV